ncbi:MAG: YjbQ family protein [Clostridiales bacterium]|nr:YjbQ family protein [Clostridiales bacterium]
MSKRTYTYNISTDNREQFIDITEIIRHTIDESGVKEGIITVFCPHTTAGITINENADPDVQRDMLVGLDKAFPIDGDYRHFEGNSHAHLKASALGSSCTIILSGARPILGTWQSVYFCEFDGPRNRKVVINISQ